MKSTLFRTLPVAALFFVAALAGAPDAQAQLGIAAGANFNNYSDIDTGNAQATFENATGYHAGLFYDAGFGPLGLRIGAYYMDAGSIEFEENRPDFQSVDVTIFEFPVDLRYTILPTPIVSPYVLAGPTFRLVNTDDEVEDFTTEDFSVAANAGVGVEVSLPGSGLSLYPEVRYAFGINDIAKDFGFQGAEEEGTRLSMIMLRLGVKF